MRTTPRNTDVTEKGMVINMKEGLHPQYEETVVRCACGETVVTTSTKCGVIRVEICSKCHPVYTGKQ